MSRFVKMATLQELPPGGGQRRWSSRAGFMRSSMSTGEILAIDGTVRTREVRWLTVLSKGQP